MLEVKMKLERETKGALRYYEVDPNENPVEIQDGAYLGTMYIRKVAFRGRDSFPQKIKVTVEDGDF